MKSERAKMSVDFMTEMTAADIIRYGGSNDRILKERWFMVIGNIDPSFCAMYFILSYPTVAKSCSNAAVILILKAKYKIF